MVSRKVRVNRLNADVVPYSGIVITASKNLDLDIAIRILESSSFFNYVQKIGIKSNGESVRISPIDIANYTFIWRINLWQKFLLMFKLILQD